MADLHYTDAELDALIESTLQDEALMPVPAHMHVRIAERIQLAAMQQKERIRFRNTLLTGFVGSVGIVALGTSLVILTNFHILLEHGISGGLGLLDYYRTTLPVVWLGHLDHIMLSTGAALAMVTFGVSLRSLWHRGTIQGTVWNQNPEPLRGGSLRAR